MITGGYTISPWFTGDVNFADSFSAEEVDSSPGQIQIVDLVIGANTITVPEHAVSVTIIPPIDNVVILTLKGVAGDAGIILNPSRPCLISLDAVTSFVINASAIVSVRFIFV